MRNKLLENRILNNLFKILIFALKKVDFQFIYNINKKLTKNNNIKK